VFRPFGNHHHTIYQDNWVEAKTFWGWNIPMERHTVNLRQYNIMILSQE